MGNFMEWLSDNLRYFILVILLGVVLIGGFFGVRAIRSIGNGKSSDVKKETQAKTTESTTEADSDIIVMPENNNGLVQNDAKVLTMMTSYYTAKTNKDIETLVKLDPSINQAQEIENLENSYVESYSNIKTYSKNGPDANSCVVYVCYDGKVRDIDTLVPSLVQFFLRTDAQGNYFISDPEGDAAASEFVEESKKSQEAQELINQVNTACEEAKASDPVLKEFMNKYSGQNSTDKDEKDTKEPEKADSDDKVPSKRQWMIANDSCNVRAEANTDCEVIGALMYGQDVEALGKSGDWYKIDYNGTEAYVSSEFLSTEEEFNSQNGSGQQTDDQSSDYYGDDSAYGYDEYYNDYSDEYGYYDDSQYAY